ALAAVLAPTTKELALAGSGASGGRAGRNLAPAVETPPTALPSPFEPLADFLLDVYPRGNDRKRLQLLPAGQRADEQDSGQFMRYADTVRSFDWQDFYQNWEGELFFEWLRQQLDQDEVDVVLIDSRTGLTEIGGISTYQVADVVVLFCATNQQNLD